MEIELTCAVSGEKLHVLLHGVCHYHKSGDATMVHMVCGKCLSVKECPEEICKLVNECCKK